MTTSKLIAGLLGPTLIANAAAMLLNFAAWHTTLIEQFARDAALIYVAGIAVFVAGLAIVLNHNVWTRSWPVVVTIFGWPGADAPSNAARRGRRPRHSGSRRVTGRGNRCSCCLAPFFSFKAYRSG